MVNPGNNRIIRILAIHLIVMKHLITCLALGLCFAAGAQQMPYNPDANADLFIGVDDVLGILGLYDTPLMQPELTCDYEGTEFESLILGAITGEIIIDSVYVEYLIYDTLTYYTPGCPELVIEPLVLERGYMFEGPSDVWSSGNTQRCSLTSAIFGYTREFRIDYEGNDNIFVLTMRDDEIGEVLPNIGSTSFWDDLSTPDDQTAALLLPFPEEWHIDEDGFQIDWRAETWTTMSEEFRIIPFWHNAE